MAIVSYDFYNGSFLGLPVAAADFPKYEAYAERLIGRATKGRVSEDNLATFPTWVQDAYKDAICEQINYFCIYGITVSVTGLTGAGFRVGEVSVNDGGGSSAKIGAASMLAPGAVAALETTGLLNPQVDTLGDPWLPYYLGVL